MVSAFYQLSAATGRVEEGGKVRYVNQAGTSHGQPLARFPGDSVELPGVFNRLSCCKPMRD
jgi:hypothetical protein